MRARGNGHDGKAAPRPPASRRDAPNTAPARAEAAAAGRWDVVDPAGLLGLQRAAGNRGVAASLADDGGGTALPAAELPHVPWRSSGASVIQRAPAVAEPGSRSPTLADDKDAPHSRNATTQEIMTAAYDKDEQKKLEIDWIESLPGPVKADIDEGYTESAAQAAFKQRVAYDPELRQIDRQRDLEKKKLQAQAVERLKADPAISQKKGAARDKALAQALAQDPAFKSQEEALEFVHQLEVGRREAELELMDVVPHSDSVAEMPTKITRLEGVAFERVNFMSWAVDVLGSSKAAEQYFMQIVPVSGTFLHEDAATRFQAAQTDFENAHAGNTFPVTYGGFALRGFHHERQNIGMLGHALGLAVDLVANDNPDQRWLTANDPTDSYKYLLEKFGGTADQKGHPIMELGDQHESIIEQLGKDTAKDPATLSPEGTAMVETIRTEFNEMVATSKRFQASIAGQQLDLLSEARDLYFNAMEAAKKKKNPGTATDSRTPEQIKAEVSEKLGKAFAEWIKVIDKDLEDANARKVISDREAAEKPKAKQELAKIRTDKPDAVDALNDYAVQYSLDKPVPTGTAREYKKYLQGQLGKKYPERNPKKDPLAQKWIKNEIFDLKRWHRRLLDPAFVFGQGILGKDGHWDTKKQSSGVPLMQLIEHGFVRQDDLKAPTSSGNEPAPASSGGKSAPSSSKSKTQFFGVEVATTLARYGFSPGATYQDTMHFDFIQGYDAVPGGRSASNNPIDEKKFGPSGDPVPAALKRPGIFAGPIL